jgi:hypothetical protein
MSRIVFETERPTTQVDPARADVACFVGLARCNPGAVLPPAVLRWLDRQGWVEGPYARLIRPLTTGNFSAGSAIVTNIPNTASMAVGMPLSGPNVAPGTTISGVESSSRIRMSANAVGTLPATGAPLGVDDPLAALPLPATIGTFESGSAIVTNIPNTANLAVGMPLSGPNVASGATVASVDSPTRIHMSASAVGTLPAIDAPLIVPVIADVPIPIETYPAFSALFDAGGSTASYGTDYVAAAVRTFFAQGGKRCYVVRVDDPLTSHDTPASRNGKLQKLLPSSAYEIDDQRGWHGAGHLAGLPDVSFLAMPDLPALAASVPPVAMGPVPVAPTGPERFVECAPADLPIPVTPPFQYSLSAPRLTPDDYKQWAQAVQSVLAFLSVGSLREMLFVAALPLPQDVGAASASENPSNSPTQHIHDVITAVMPEQGGLGTGISTAFLQLAYPWLKTTGSQVLLEGLEPPDGALTGLLARNALTRGTFASATKVAPAEVYDISPILPGQETTSSPTPLSWGDNSFKPLIERISLFGFTPGGLRLLSDVTTYAGESYRPGRIHRLVSVILRASRTLGERVTFQQNEPLLWTRVQSFLRQLMTRLWEAGALDGATIADAFSVRCDRSTMTQNDLDNGRLVAVVSFNAASTIELIRVTLALETSGTSSQSIAALGGTG